MLSGASFVGVFAQTLHLPTILAFAGANTSSLSKSLFCRYHIKKEKRAGGGKDGRERRRKGGELTHYSERW